MSKRTMARRPTKKNVVTVPRGRKKELPEIEGLQQSWQQMFILAEHWQSDLAFFQDEIHFMRALIDRHFRLMSWMRCDEENSFGL